MAMSYFLGWKKSLALHLAHLGYTSYHFPPRQHHHIFNKEQWEAHLTYHIFLIILWKFLSPADCGRKKSSAFWENVTQNCAYNTGKLPSLKTKRGWHQVFLFQGKSTRALSMTHPALQTLQSDFGEEFLKKRKNRATYFFDLKRWSSAVFYRFKRISFLLWHFAHLFRKYKCL